MNKSSSTLVSFASSLNNFGQADTHKLRLWCPPCYAFRRGLPRALSVRFFSQPTSAPGRLQTLYVLCQIVPPKNT